MPGPAVQALGPLPLTTAFPFCKRGNCTVALYLASVPAMVRLHLLGGTPGAPPQPWEFPPLFHAQMHTARGPLSPPSGLHPRSRADGALLPREQSCSHLQLFWLLLFSCVAVASLLVHDLSWCPFPLHPLPQATLVCWVSVSCPLSRGLSERPCGLRVLGVQLPQGACSSLSFLI